MSNHMLAKLLTDELPSGRPNLFNPWHDRCTDDKPSNGPDAKLGRLAAHLGCKPLFILCGEAPSYRGCRHSGIAFTSECLLFHGKIPRISSVGQRLTTRKDPYSEQSATIVWKALYDLRIAERTILWNALQMHPHKPGNKHSNRTPTFEELKIGERALRTLAKKFPSAKVVAVGRKAERSLNKIGIPATYVRHPANGGATAFAAALKLLVGNTIRSASL